MKKEAITHIPLSQYAYATGDRSLVIRLRAAKGDLKACTVCYGDRVDPKPDVEITRVPMKKAASDDLFDYFETEIHDRYSRICYYFVLDDGQETLCYYERDFSKKLNCSRTEYFQFPYIRREDRIDEPKWAKEVVMYHIFPDSFASGYRSLSGRGTAETVTGEHGVICRVESALGGTLEGVRCNLDYLESMGINCLYLNPVFAANSYHKYDTVDYFRIDPCLGDLADAKRLVEDCHDRGIRVLFDGVFNHCGPDFFAFRDVLKKGKKSAYYDWFYEMPEQISYTDPPNYEAFAYVKEMPKLNTGNPKVEEYLISVGTSWIREVGIDGWRLDVANEINHGFWRRFRQAVRAVRPDAFLIGEIWEDAGCFLAGDQFDSTMNYRFSYLCRDFFAERTMSVTAFHEQMIKMIYRYPTPVSLTQMNFLDSHDVPRFLSYCDGDKRRLLLAMFYLIMGYGIPSVFYGDERYVEGDTEPEYRKGMPWEEGEHFCIALQEWIELRHRHSALREGSYEAVVCDDAAAIYGFARRNREETVFILLNNGDSDFACGDLFWQEAERKLGGTVLLKEKAIGAMAGRLFTVS